MIGYNCRFFQVRKTNRRSVQRLKEAVAKGEETDEHNYNPAWKPSHKIPSGRLLGIYKKYILIRPSPSLRVIFASPSAKKLGKLEQHPFLTHVAAPLSTLSSLKDSFQSGAPVTAKIAIKHHAGTSRSGIVTEKWSKR